VLSVRVVRPVHGAVLLVNGSSVVRPRSPAPGQRRKGQTNEWFIRRTIKPALRPMKVRKVRGLILDKLYAELKRCGDLSCTLKPFIEHCNVPVLTVDPRDSRPAW
jgi:hypothetical protein